MAQFDFPVLDPLITSGTELANWLNAWAQALESLHSGAVRPAYAGEGLLWLDKAGGAADWHLKLFDGANDIDLGRINSTTDGYAPAVDGKPAATVDDAIAYAIALG